MYLLLLSVSLGTTVFFIVFIISKNIFSEKIDVAKRIDHISKNITNIFILDEKEKTIGKLKTKRKQKRIKKEWKYLKALGDELISAGIMMKADEFLLIWVFATFLPATFIFLITNDIVPAIALMVLGFVLPLVLINRAKKKYLELFEKQLSEALIVICNCLQSGLTFMQAFNSIATEMPNPISKEFSRVTNEIRWGTSLETALTNMSKRIPSQELTMVVSSIIICRQVGGNLSDILNSISMTIKERTKIKREIRVLTTTGRTSGSIIGLLPVIMFGVLMLITPDHIKLFFSTQLGKMLLILAVLMEATGFMFIRKITNIKF